MDKSEKKKIPLETIEKQIDLYSNDELRSLEAMAGSLLEDRMRQEDELHEEAKEEVLREELHREEMENKLPEDERRKF